MYSCIFPVLFLKWWVDFIVIHQIMFGVVFLTCLLATSQSF